MVLIWQFTSAWNDYLFALFFSNSRNGPVTISLNFLASGQLGRWFVGGLMAGSVKG